MTDQLKQLSEAATPERLFRRIEWDKMTKRARVLFCRASKPGADETVYIRADIAEAQLTETQLAEDGAMQIIASERAEVLSLRKQLTEAKAREAVAYGVAAKYHDEIFKHDSAGIEYSSLVGIPISNLGELEASCRRAEIDAKAIRALTPTHTTTALEQIKQQARDEGKREAFHEAAYAIEKRAEEIVQNHLPVSAFNELRDAANSIRSILATLSDTPKGVQ